MGLTPAQSVVLLDDSLWGKFFQKMLMITEKGGRNLIKTALNKLLLLILKRVQFFRKNGFLKENRPNLISSRQEKKTIFCHLLLLENPKLYLRIKKEENSPNLEKIQNIMIL